MLKVKPGLSLETLQCKRASSSIQGRISWFAWSCGRKLRVLLVLGVYLGGPACISSGKSDLLWLCEGHLWIPLSSLQE